MNPFGLKIHPFGQECILELINGISCWNLPAWADYAAGHPEWFNPRQWAHDPYCLIRFPQPGHYTALAWVNTVPEWADLIGQIGGTYSFGADGMLTEQEADAAWLPWATTPFWTVNVECAEMLRGHTRALQSILRRMFFDPLPNPQASRLPAICELNNSTGCAGHPAGTHQSGRDVDICYITKGTSNVTQAPGEFHPDLIFTDEVIDPAKFDAARNAALWLRIADVFPGAVIRVDQRIFMHMIGLYPELSNILEWDSPGMYHHDTHCHASLGMLIDWEAI